jgi:hypothetical protein
MGLCHNFFFLFLVLWRLRQKESVANRPWIARIYTLQTQHTNVVLFSFLFFSFLPSRYKMWKLSLGPTRLVSISTIVHTQAPCEHNVNPELHAVRKESQIKARTEPLIGPHANYLPMGTQFPACYSHCKDGKTIPVNRENKVKGLRATCCMTMTTLLPDAIQCCLPALLVPSANQCPDMPRYKGMSGMEPMTLHMGASYVP